MTIFYFVPTKLFHDSETLGFKTATDKVKNISWEYSPKEIVIDLYVKNEPSSFKSECWHDSHS